MLVAPFSGSLSDRVGIRLLTCFGAGISSLALLLMSQVPVSANAADVMWAGPLRIRDRDFPIS
jgi:hypothetical protein